MKELEVVDVESKDKPAYLFICFFCLLVCFTEFYYKQQPIDLS